MFHQLTMTQRIQFEDTSCREMFVDTIREMRMLSYLFSDMEDNWICFQRWQNTSKVLGYIQLIWLSKGLPYLNMIEQCWKIGKHVLSVSQYHAMFAVMNKAVFEYFRKV